MLSQVERNHNLITSQLGADLYAHGWLSSYFLPGRQMTPVEYDVIYKSLGFLLRCLPSLTARIEGIFIFCLLGLQFNLIMVCPLLLFSFF